MVLVDDELFRDQPFATTMSLSGAERTQLIVGRAIRTPWWFHLTGYMDLINGGSGVITSPTGILRLRSARRRRKRPQGVKGQPDLGPDGKCGECERLDKVSFVKDPVVRLVLALMKDELHVTSITLQTGRESVTSAQRGTEDNAEQRHT